MKDISSRMKSSAKLYQELIPEEQEIVCIDGKNTDLLESMREFFSSYNLAVIENFEAGVPCLYWLLCGTAEEVVLFHAEKNRQAKGVIAIVLNASFEDAVLLSKKINAKVARIAHKKLTSAEGRVVFGLLFSNTTDVVTISEEKQVHLISETVTEEYEHTLDSQKPLSSHKINRSINNNGPHTSWEHRSTEIETLIKKTYTKEKRHLPVDRLFSFLRLFAFSFATLIVVHITSVFISLAGIYISIKDTNAAVLPLVVPIMTFAIESGNFLTSPIKILNIPNPYDPVVVLLTRTKNIATIILSQENLTAITSGLEENYKNTTRISSAAQGILVRLSPEISLLQADLKSIQNMHILPWSLSIIKNKIIQLNETLADLQEINETLDSFAAVLPKLTDGPEEKSFLLLFQNNRELRPAGGFIGSVGFATFKKGSLTALDIQDVYTIDGQLTGHVDPPLPIRTLLEQEHWYLRDSNWSANFPISAEKAAWFLEKSTRKRVDGVISISLPVIEDLFTIIGPVTLQENNTQISADSVFEYIYTTTRQGFFPGSTAKKDTISRLSDVLLSKINTLQPKQAALLAATLTKHLRNRNIQLYMVNPVVQKQLEERGFSGSFPPVSPCPTKDDFCINDTLAVVEANLGINKANSGVTRSYSRSISFEKNDMRREDTILLKNTNSNYSLGGGTYKSYSRVYYPLGTSIGAVFINNQLLPVGTQSAQIKQPPYVESIDELAGYITLGFATKTEPGNTTSIRIISWQSFTQNIKALSLGLYKQAGVENIDVSLFIDPPWGTSVRQQKEAGVFTDDIAKLDDFSYNIKLRRDKNIVVLFDPEEP